MKEITLKLTIMAHGGAAMGRDETGRPVFVPYAIPGETARVSLTTEKRHFARADLLDVVETSPDRVEPRCAHFGVCGGCHFQHIAYEAQLRHKQIVVGDQMQRIGGFNDVVVRPVLAHPSPWEYRVEVSLSPVTDGGLGFWSSREQQVIPIQNCPVIHPRLQALWQDFDLDLPGLRKLKLRIGDDEALLAVLEVDGVEPPELAADFPVSVALALPDKTAVSLIGDNYIMQQVKGRDFRVSPGCFFQPSLAGAEMLVDAVLAYADLTGAETVLDGYSGVGMLTAFLAEKAAQMIAVESNLDAVADTAVNLQEFDHISLFEGLAEEVLPQLDAAPDVIVVNPEGGMATAVLQAITALSPARLIIVSSDLPALARDGKQLAQAGYKLVEIQPIDMTPHTFQIDTVSLWQR